MDRADGRPERSIHLVFESWSRAARSALVKGRRAASISCENNRPNRREAERFLADAARSSRAISETTQCSWDQPRSA